MMNRKFQIALIFIIALLLVFALVFIPAGTLNWPEGWLFIIIQFSYSALVAMWLMNHNPELAKKRFLPKMPSYWWDKVVTFVGGAFFLLVFVVAGLDAVRYGISHIPYWLKAIAFLLFTASLYCIFLTMKVNPYLSRVAELQPHQKVITIGPYSIVRHPMYAAFMVMLFVLPIALGSWCALIPAAGEIFFLIARTVMEDKMLQQGLEGYKEYAKKTRYRLLPGIW